MQHWDANGRCRPRWRCCCYQRWAQRPFPPRRYFFVTEKGFSQNVTAAVCLDSLEFKLPVKSLERLVYTWFKALTGGNFKFWHSFHFEQRKPSQVQHTVQFNFWWKIRKSFSYHIQKHKKGTIHTGSHTSNKSYRKYPRWKFRPLARFTLSRFTSKSKSDCPYNKNYLRMRKQQFLFFHEIFPVGATTMKWIGGCVAIFHFGCSLPSTVQAFRKATKGYAMCKTKYAVYRCAPL